LTRRPVYTSSFSTRVSGLTLMFQAEISTLLASPAACR
jgi:hypothetical protein